MNGVLRTLAPCTDSVYVLTDFLLIARSSWPCFHSTDQSPKDSFRIGKPEVIYLFSGHYSSFLYLPYVEVKSLSFFKKKFELK